MSEPVLEARDVVRDFGEEVLTRVLRGVSFQLAAGEFAALVGPSGSGKSTLLNLIGLLDRPTSGQIVVDGLDTASLDEQGLTRFRGRMLGFVFQFHHLLPAFSVLENVLLPGYAQLGPPTREARERAREVLDGVGLSGKLKSSPRELSGGQQQRVAIARALVHRPRLVLADEPTGNLDTQTANEVFALMRSFNERFGITFLVVTHDPRLAERCDRTILLVDGRIVDEGERAPLPARSAE